VLIGLCKGISFPRAAIAVDMLPYYETQAKKRQQAAGGDRRSEQAKMVVVKMPEPIDKGEAR